MEMDTNMRSFENSKGEVFYIKQPTIEDIRGADWTYSKVYTKSLTDGIATNSEMLDILRMRGVIGPEYEQRARELADNLNLAVSDLALAKTDDAKRDLAIEVALARDELFRWNQRFRGPMNHTCEQIADDARLEYLTTCMVCNDKKERVWKEYNSYLNEKDNDLAMKARVEVMLYLQGVDSNFMEKTPEAMALRELEDKFAAELEEKTKLHDALAEEERSFITTDSSEDVENKEDKKQKKQNKKK